MKLDHNVCYNDISDKFESGSCQVKNFKNWSSLPNTSSLGQIFTKKTLLLVIEAIFPNTLENWSGCLPL